MVATALQPNIPRTSSASKTAGSASATEHSTLEALGTQPTAAEGQHISDLQEQFQQQAQKDPAGFRMALRAAFGDKASLAEIDQLLDLALSGKLPMPSSIQFVEAGSLGSDAFGAYDASNGGSLYLDRSLLSDPEKLQSVFNEEMGHHLDALLGGADAAGDEGAVFSRTLEQGQLSQRELTALKSENDHGVIQIEGRWVQVEFNEEGDSDSGDSGESSGSTDSGSGECSADSGSSASDGSTGSESAGDGDGSSDSGDSSGECSVGDTGDTNKADTTNSPHESDNRDDDKDRNQIDNSDSGRKEDNGVPSEEETSSDLDALSKMGTGVSVADAFAQELGKAAIAAEAADDVVAASKRLSAGAQMTGYGLMAADPAIAVVHELQRARSEGADAAEQIDRASRAGLQRLDNVAVGALGGIVGSPLGPLGSAATGATVGIAYGGSPADEAFDFAVDTVADEIQSPRTNAQGYVNWGTAGPNLTIGHVFSTLPRQ